MSLIYSLYSTRKPVPSIWSVSACCCSTAPGEGGLGSLGQADGHRHRRLFFGGAGGQRGRGRRSCTEERRGKRLHWDAGDLRGVSRVLNHFKSFRLWSYSDCWRSLWLCRMAGPPAKKWLWKTWPAMSSMILTQSTVRPTHLSFHSFLKSQERTLNLLVNFFFLLHAHEKLEVTVLLGLPQGPTILFR